MAMRESDALTVATSEGLVRGTGSGVRVFRGIPYAAPPTGDLRWRAPRPREAWSGVRDTTEFAPDAVQIADPQLRGSGMSEDCLYLNVWTPARSDSERLPVMVWIHGNGYTRGSGSHATYDGRAFADNGVVLVTVNYRLGLPGFLAHAAFTAESPHGSSGNYGLLDQIAALGWVRRNIAAFGGDPGRVTVFGQSAGGTCTSLLMASDLAKGLIHQAILQSPGTMRPMATLSEAEVLGQRIGTDATAMRRIPVGELLEMTSLLVPRVRKLASPRGMGPIIDGWVVKGDDIQNYLSGAIRPIPLMVGTAVNEGRRLAEHFPIRIPADLDAYLDDSFGSGTILPISYRANSDAEVAPALERVVGDTQFTYGAWSVARQMRALGGKVHQYLFAQPRPDTKLAPTHDDELPFVFGTLQNGGIRVGPESREHFNEGDAKLSKVMTAAWASFAAGGNPNGGLAVGLDWPASETGDSVFTFGPMPGLAKLPRVEDLEFLRAYFGHKG
jgi:carboxylesterase type B